MGDQINQLCLHVNEKRVFVSYENGVLRTANSDYYHRYNRSSYRLDLDTPPSYIPFPGQPLRITSWHQSMPVKIEMLTTHGWRIIFEKTELPDGLHCLCGEHQA